RLNRPPCYFDTTWQWLIGAAGRTSTCIVPLRRRMPDVFEPGSIPKWSEPQDFHLRPPGPRPDALKTELRSDKMADPKGFAPSAFPQTTGCSAIELRIQNGGRCYFEWRSKNEECRMR